jgi:hypothetical protein
VVLLFIIIDFGEELTTTSPQESCSDSLRKSKISIGKACGSNMLHYCLLHWIVLCCWCSFSHIAAATRDNINHRGDLSHHSYDEDPISRVLSFDGEIWDFDGEESMVDIIQGSQANSMFGYSIAVHDNKMIIGAMGANTSKGGAYIYYRHEDEIWRVDKFLTLDDAVEYDQFGCAVAMYDYTVVVGANKREASDGWKTDAGAAYIYEKEGARWEMTMDLTPDDVTTQDYFGSAVSIHRNTTVVGCWGCDSMGSFSGAAYVFSKWDGEWQFNEKIFANNGARYNWFGISVSIHEDVIAVGATGVTSGATLEKTGAAYLFCNTHDDRQYDGMRYVECAELLPGDGREGDSFGASVAIHSGVVVVGSPMADPQSGEMENIGAVYMYYQDIYNDWHYLQKMTAYEPSIDGHFGKSVDVFNDIVVVGGYNASGSGAVYIYGEEYELSQFEADTDAVWKLAFIMTPPEEEELGDFYGYSVALYDATVVVGAHGMDVSRSANGVSRTLSHAGGVYSYYGGTSRIRVPYAQYETTESSSSAALWVVLGVFLAAVLVLTIGGGFLLYNKRTYGVYVPRNRIDSSPISDWLPSSFHKAFGAEGEYATASLDSSHGISSSHGMIPPDATTGGVNNSSASSAKMSSNDQMNKLFDADEEFDKDQQMLDDSLSKFQLKRQNRISIKKKKGDGS